MRGEGPRRAASRRRRPMTWSGWTESQRQEVIQCHREHRPRCQHRQVEGWPHALAYKPKHAMDLATGAVVAAEAHPADQGDTTTMPGTLASAAEHLAAVDAKPTPEAPAELIADKGYHSRDALKALDNGPWSRAFPSRIATNSRVGTATMPRAGRSTTIERGCFPALHARRSSCAPNWWSAGLR